jgi:serine/threonine protein kinase
LTECQGGLYKKLRAYSTKPNDIWSLGVILINLVCGRNPWKQANADDETFNAYLRNPDFLMSILPISKQLNTLLKQIFCVDPSKRINIQELRSHFLSCEYYTCQEEKAAKPISVQRKFMPQTCTQSPSFQSAVLQYAYGFVDTYESDDDDLFPGSSGSISSSGSSLSWSSLENDFDCHLKTTFVKQDRCPPPSLSSAVTFDLSEEQALRI